MLNQSMVYQQIQLTVCFTQSFFFFPLLIFFLFYRCCWLSQVTGLKSRDFLAKLQVRTVLSPFLGSAGARALCCIVRRWHPGCQGGTVQIPHQEHLENTCACHREHFIAVPSSTKLQNGEGAGAALRKGCATETTVVNLVKNEVKLANTSHI